MLFRSRAAEEAAAKDGNAYMAHAVCHTAAATSGVLMYLKNTSPDKDFHITRIYIDPQAIASTDLLIVQGLSPTSVSSGTDVTTSAIKQKNTNQPNIFSSAGAQLLISDAAADITIVGGDQLHEFPLASRTSVVREMHGTNVIGPGGSFYIGYKREGGRSATDGNKISLSVNGYAEAAERE